MSEVYYVKIKKSYATAIIEDLQKMKAVELLEEAPVPEWQKKEVRRRLCDLKKHPETGIPYKSAMREIKKMK